MAETITTGEPVRTTDCPRSAEHRLHVVYVFERCPHCGGTEELPRHRGMTLAEIEAVSCHLIWQSGYEMRRAEVERRARRFGEDLDAAIVAAVKEQER